MITELNGSWVCCFLPSDWLVNCWTCQIIRIEFQTGKTLYILRQGIASKKNFWFCHAIWQFAWIALFWTSCIPHLKYAYDLLFCITKHRSSPYTGTHLHLVRLYRYFNHHVWYTCCLITFRKKWLQHRSLQPNRRVMMILSVKEAQIRNCHVHSHFTYCGLFDQCIKSDFNMIWCSLIKATFPFKTVTRHLITMIYTCF